MIIFRIKPNYFKTLTKNYSNPYQLKNKMKCLLPKEEKFKMIINLLNQ